MHIAHNDQADVIDVDDDDDEDEEEEESESDDDEPDDEERQMDNFFAMHDFRRLVTVKTKIQIFHILLITKFYRCRDDDLN